MTAAFETSPCLICADSSIAGIISLWRGAGYGYKRCWRELVKEGYQLSRDKVQEHCAHVERSVMSAISDIEDRAIEVTADWFQSRGIETPPGFVAGTIEVRGENGEKHWLRVKPEQPEEERLEVRQAEPVIVSGPVPSPTILIPGNWQTWVLTPDLQTGWWLDSEGQFHTIHDERAIDITFQVGIEVANAEGLHGWLDVGDTLDGAAVSTHDPGIIDTQVKVVNMASQRLSDIMAMRRHIVGPDGELVVIGGNHEIRWMKMTQKQMPYLVGLKRADDPEDEHPVMSVPYLARFRDHGVKWVNSYPNCYYRVNSNLAAFHAPAYSNRPLQSAQKISDMIDASVVFGHTHRRESYSWNKETIKGVRTFEVWSDGTLARIDGSVPSAKSTYDDYGNRLTQAKLFEKFGEEVGMLPENWHQGFSIVHVEKGGRERFAREPVVIWDGFAVYRGTSFTAHCDVEGNPLTTS